MNKKDMIVTILLACAVVGLETAFRYTEGKRLESIENRIKTYDDNVMLSRNVIKNFL